MEFRIFKKKKSLKKKKKKTYRHIITDNIQQLFYDLVEITRTHMLWPIVMALINSLRLRSPLFFCSADKFVMIWSIGSESLKN